MGSGKSKAKNNEQENQTVPIKATHGDSPSPIEKDRILQTIYSSVSRNELYRTPVPAKTTFGIWQRPESLTVSSSSTTNSINRRGVEDPERSKTNPDMFEINLDPHYHPSSVSSNELYRTPIPGKTTFGIWQRPEHLTISSSSTTNTINRRRVEDAERSKINPDMFEINLDPHYRPSSVVAFLSLMDHEYEYYEILSKITNKRNFIVDSIERIENPYLKKAYELKKEQKILEDPFVEEHLLFHGTKRCNVDAICELNFNWRMCKQHKYGRGISFTPNSTYASNYSDRNVYNKVMIVAKVLIGNICIGDEFMTLPNDGCDTSEKIGGVVLVKYEDNEFYPAYKVNYHLVDENVGRKTRTYRRRF